MPQMTDESCLATYDLVIGWKGNIKKVFVLTCHEHFRHRAEGTPHKMQNVSWPLNG